MTTSKIGQIAAVETLQLDHTANPSRVSSLEQITLLQIIPTASEARKIEKRSGQWRTLELLLPPSNSATESQSLSRIVASTGQLWPSKTRKKQRKNKKFMAVLLGKRNDSDVGRVVSEVRFSSCRGLDAA